LLEQQQQQQQMQAIRAWLDLSSSTSHQQQLNNNLLIHQSPPPTLIPFQNNQEILVNSSNLIQNQPLSLHQQLIQQVNYFLKFIFLIFFSIKSC